MTTNILFSAAGLFHTPKTKEKSVTGISKRDYDEEEEDDEDEEYQPSDGSENEMETEILDYMWILKPELYIFLHCFVTDE